MKPRTMNRRRLERVNRYERQLTEPPMTPAEPRPRTRGECEGGCRPCPFVGCRYNLYLDVKPNGSVVLNFPDRQPEDMPPEESCALDVADEGQHTLDRVGLLMNLTRERTRQIEADAHAKAQSLT